MKRMFLLLLVILLSATDYAQIDTAVIKKVDNSLAAHYFQKSRSNAKTALILAGTGVVATALAVAITPKDYDFIFGTNSSKTETQAGIAALLGFTGVTLIICSVPHFIIAGITLHKAKVLMRTERISLSPQLKLPVCQFKTGIAITI